jgi:DNA replication and repair protein RecF
MQIKTLELSGWRNHNKYTFNFGDITIFVGPNASGKTNFLEAIYYLACGRSFRTKDENLPGWESGFARIQAQIVKKDTQEELLVVLEKGARLIKTVKIKEQKVASGKLLGHLNCVLFTPEEIELISTLPEARRRYLNMIISQSDIYYAHNLIHFRRTLEQRNALLKRIFLGNSQESELEVWDGKLAEYASFIMKARAEYVNNVNKYISEHYTKLSGKGQKLEVIYKPSIPVAEGWAGMLTRLTERRSNDILSRVTSIGPHRDDMEFQLEGRNVIEFASRGEFRTVILALKLAEVDFLTQKTGEKPVLLLDDVFSELDESRRDLLSQIFTNQQTVVTTTDLDHVSQNILDISKVVEMLHE